jgi:hypothetical protein
MNNLINNSFIKLYNKLNEETNHKLLNLSINGGKINIQKIDNFYYVFVDGVRYLFSWKNIVNINNIELLQFANLIRTYYIDTLKELIINYFENSCNKRNNISYNKSCTVTSIGSTSLTSNYNITVSSFILSTDIVSKFNNYFYDFWKDTSGEIFDTNLYGNCFFLKINGNLNLNKNILFLYEILEVGKKKYYIYHLVKIILVKTH